jgi:Asp-tRNA(Asn)/Glu-tRNA(Gln) amidotransferase A subunit family amidase
MDTLKQRLPDSQSNSVSRRSFLAAISGAAGGAWAPQVGRAAAAQDNANPVHQQAMPSVERLIDLAFTDAERDTIIDGLDDQLKVTHELHQLSLPNHLSPALQFHPELPGMTWDGEQRASQFSPAKMTELPAQRDDLAWRSVLDLAGLVETRKISAVELTQIYLQRLKKENERLHCVVSFTEERALAQARRADQEIAQGRYRGPLHGIPWGAKDLFAVPGYKTTWGAMPYRDQELDQMATVVERLDSQGAVLVAKTTLGALAMGDVWFGGKTRNPWNPDKGSSGSSAGSAAATAAGCLGFSLGTETLGSIVSPCTVCGVTGLRPSFGRVSRYGAMALSWTMDKIGPICRTVEDCALVFNAIFGPDGKDGTARIEAPFNWDATRDLKTLKIGYLKSDFAGKRRDSEWQENDLQTLQTMRSLGVELVPLELPDMPVHLIRFVLSVEAAAAFDELTRSGRDDLLVRQSKNAWPNLFRKAQLISAVDYVQAMRLRSLLIEKMHALMSQVDVCIAPSWEGRNLLVTNLVGLPAVVLPNGFRKNGEPTSITFTGKLFGEAEALLAAKCYQDVTDFHLKHPS